MAPKPSSESAKQKLAQIAEEHRHLWDSLARVEQATELSALIPALNELRTQLEHHFAEEESPGGLADAVVEAKPQNQRRLAGLFAEHKRMLAATASMVKRAQAVIDGPQAQIMDDVRKLGRTLRAHEQTETELFMDAVYSDIGSGD